MSRYAACYDIADDRSRRHVARILLGYGRRVQWSVYEVSLDPEDLRELRATVGAWLAKTDRFDIFPIDTRRPEARLSWQRRPVTDDIVFAGPFPSAATEEELAESIEWTPPEGESPSK